MHLASLYAVVRGMLSQQLVVLLGCGFGLFVVKVVLCSVCLGLFVLKGLTGLGVATARFGCILGGLR